jgi:hypothetical protein
MKVVSVLAVLALSSAALAQSTAFTYQGRLTSGGNPASGPHDMQVRLFDAASGGTQVGPTLCFDNVPVAAGVFTVQPDFGQQFATPSPRFLEIQVRSDTGQPCTDQVGYIVLTPRQALLATPLAIHAKSAFALDAADGSPAGALMVDSSGNVGIGTASPTHTVHVATGAPTIALQDTDSSGAGGGTQVGYVSYRDSGNTERAWVGYGSAGSAEFSMVNARPSGNMALWTPGSIRLISNGAERMTIDAFGSTTLNSRVGIGTSPTNTGLLVAAGNTYGIFAYGDDTGIRGNNSIPGATGVYGVMGQVITSDAGSFGVFASGRLGATGTKSFRIDHPDDPANAYLFHYSAESPEVINFYRGTVTLDAAGGAVVHLPPYFARINTSPSYQLTAVGAPMPMLHVSERISEGALERGASLPPGANAETCRFSIAGGSPGGDVSWRVEARRNDAFVRANGAPVEVQKPAHERGTFQHPALYGQPESRGVDSRREAERGARPADPR